MDSIYVVDGMVNLRMSSVDFMDMLEILEDAEEEFTLFKEMDEFAQQEFNWGDDDSVEMSE